MSNTPKEAKSLKWLANMFPFIDDPKDDIDKMTNAIHVYCEAGANCIEMMLDKIDALTKEISDMNRRVSNNNIGEDTISDDLISRSKFIDELKLYLNRNFLGEFTAQSEIRVGEIMTIIKNIPIAYDIKAVNKELGKFAESPCTLHECGIRSERCSMCMAKKAIEIVRSGGSLNEKV